jgi:glycosyltransferase involved in cell wall biosynthesis
MIKGITNLIETKKLRKRTFDFFDKHSFIVYELIIKYNTYLPNAKVINKEQHPRILNLFQSFINRYRKYLNSKKEKKREYIAEKYLIPITNILFDKNYVNFAQLLLLAMEEYFLSHDSEESFESCLDKITISAESAGLRFKRIAGSAQSSESKGNKIGICGHGIAISGYEVIAALCNDLPDTDDISIYTMTVYDSEHTQKYFGKINIDIHENPSKKYDVFQYKRLLEANEVSVAVWVMPPMHMIFLFSYGLASRQVWLSQYLRPNIKIKSIDKLLTYGGVGTNHKKRYNNREWNIIPQIYPSENKGVYLFSPARIEKIKGTAFLECVAKILKKVPNSIFKWTGYENDNEINEFFDKMGLKYRHKYIGWCSYENLVIEIETSDIILSTFPLGLGTVELIAAEKNIPIVSMFDDTKNLYWRDIHWEAVNGNEYLASLCLDENRASIIRKNSNIEEYVATTVDLVKDDTLKKQYTKIYKKSYKYAFKNNPNGIGRQFLENIIS